MARAIAWDVVVVGGANTDYLVKGRELPSPGAIVQGDAFQEAAGGKGANQAVAAARLGASVTFLGAVGRDAMGDEAEAALRAEGIDVSGMARVDEPTLLPFVCAPLAPEGVCRAARLRGSLRLRGLRIRSDVEADAPAARRRARDSESRTGANGRHAEATGRRGEARRRDGQTRRRDEQR